MKDANTSAVPSMLLLLLPSLLPVKWAHGECVLCVFVGKKSFFSALVYKKGLTKGLTRKIDQKYEMNFRIRLF